MAAGSLPFAARLAIAVPLLAGAVWLGTVQRQEARLEDANAALARGEGNDAARLARAADGSTVRARAARTVSLAQLRLGELADAEREMSRAARFAPEDWTVHYDRAILLRRLGRREAAARAMGRALALNPRAALPPGFGSGG